MSTGETAQENLPKLNEDIYGVILKFVQQNKRDDLNRLIERVKKTCTSRIYGNVEIERSIENLDEKSNEERLIFHATTPLLQDVTQKFDNLGLARMLWQSKPEEAIMKHVGKIVM